MAESTQVAAKKVAAPKKVVKPKVAKTTTSAHPPYLEMVVAAVTALKERRGSSRQAILKYILANYNVGGIDPKSANLHLKQALKRGILAGSIKNTKVNYPHLTVENIILVIFVWNNIHPNLSLLIWLSINSILP